MKSDRRLYQVTRSGDVMNVMGREERETKVEIMDGRRLYHMTSDYF